MCGRFTLRASPAELAEIFELLREPEWTPRFNIAPTQPVMTLRDGHGGRQAAVVQWGLVPSWSKDLAIGSRLINARSETVAEKPSFRSAFRYRRCLVPADGFYEWAKTSSKTKQPYYIFPATDQLFAFAGLWESWNAPDGSVLETCTILTTAANEILSDIHNRMPVILPKTCWKTWLDPKNQSPSELQPLLVRHPADKMRRVLVSTVVNNPRNETPACIEPLDTSSHVSS